MTVTEYHSEHTFKGDQNGHQGWLDNNKTTRKLFEHIFKRFSTFTL